MTAVPLGDRCIAVTVRWKNMRADGSVAREWWQSYNIVRLAGGLRMLTSIFHLKGAAS